MIIVENGTGTYGWAYHPVPFKVKPLDVPPADISLLDFLEYIEFPKGELNEEFKRIAENTEEWDSARSEGADVQ